MRRPRRASPPGVISPSGAVVFTPPRSPGKKQRSAAPLCESVDVPTSKNNASDVVNFYRIAPRPPNRSPLWVPTADAFAAGVGTPWSVPFQLRSDTEDMTSSLSELNANTVAAAAGTASGPLSQFRSEALVEEAWDSSCAASRSCVVHSGMPCDCSASRHTAHTRSSASGLVGGSGREHTRGASAGDSDVHHANDAAVISGALGMLASAQSYLAAECGCAACLDAKKYVRALQAGSRAMVSSPHIIATSFGAAVHRPVVGLRRDSDPAATIAQLTASLQANCSVSSSSSSSSSGGGGGDDSMMWIENEAQAAEAAAETTASQRFFDALAYI